jgi:hypothetical protein
VVAQKQRDKKSNPGGAAGIRNSSVSFYGVNFLTPTKPEQNLSDAIL